MTFSQFFKKHLLDHFKDNFFFYPNGPVNGIFQKTPLKRHSSPVGGGARGGSEKLEIAMNDLHCAVKCQELSIKFAKLFYFITQY